MNSLVTYLWITLFIFLMSCAISKKENERIEKLISAEEFAAKPEIADSLTNDILSSYEARAIQKLDDFYDYLNLLCAEQYDNAVKSEIRKMAVELFYDDQVLINPLNLTVQDTSMSIVDFLDEHASKTAPSEAVVESVEMEEHLKRATEDAYIGIITFWLQDANDSSSAEVRKNADISLRRITKNINAASIVVWEVYLDRIY